MLPKLHISIPSMIPTPAPELAICQKVYVFKAQLNIKNPLAAPFFLPVLIVLFLFFFLKTSTTSSEKENGY